MKFRYIAATVLGLTLTVPFAFSSYGTIVNDSAVLPVLNLDPVSFHVNLNNESSFQPFLSIDPISKIMLETATNEHSEAANNNSVFFSFMNSCSAFGWERNGISSQFRFRLSDGTYLKGWRRFGKAWLFFDKDGYCKTNMFSVDGKLYDMDSYGRMVTGWKTLNGKSYYFLPEDSVASSDVSSVSKEVSFERPFFSESDFSWDPDQFRLCPLYGQAATGWQTIDEKKYYFTSSGEYDQMAELKMLTTAVDEACKTDREVLSITGGDISEQSEGNILFALNEIRKVADAVSFVLIDINTGSAITYDPKEYIFSASTLKGPYVCALGAFGAENLKEYEELIDQTLSLSNNDTYAELHSIYGPEYMENLAKMTNVLGDFDETELYTQVRAKDLAKLWIGNLEFFRSGNEDAEWIMPYFRHSRFSFIDMALEWKYPVYSKAGWDYVAGTEFNVYNDAGIVMKGENPYILAVLSNASLYLDNTKMHKLVLALDAAHSELIQ